MTGLMSGLIGGMLIGAAASLMLLFNGRVTGISGIYAGLLTRAGQAEKWRWAFVGGLMAGGLLLQLTSPLTFLDTVESSWTVIAVAGLLVGFGTVMAGGCTSGHGICGLSRRSPRSLVATAAFILTGLLMVSVIKHYLGVG